MSTYTHSNVFSDRRIEKIVGSGEDGLEKMYKRFKDEMPQQNLLSAKARDKTYAEININTFEYLIFNCKKADSDIKMKALVSLLARTYTDEIIDPFLDNDEVREEVTERFVGINNNNNNIIPTQPEPIGSAFSKSEVEDDVPAWYEMDK